MNRRKKGLRGHKIKVMLVSDDKLVLEGWEQAIAHAPDIDSRRTVYKPDRKLPPEISDAVDIFLFEAPLLKHYSFRKWIADQKFKNRAKTIAVFKDKKLLSRNRRLLDEAIQTGFHRQELLNLIHGLRYDDKSLCTYYDQELRKAARSSTQKKYTDLIQNILLLVFDNNLQHPQMRPPQPKSETRETYLIFENHGTHPFWAGIKKKHNSDYIVFSVQNDPPAMASQFHGMTSFLSEPFGKLGLVVNRQPTGGQHLELQLAAYNNEGNVILVLFNQTLHSLLAAKAAGADPADLLDDLYQELFVAMPGKKR
jgi:hypothetical protein